MELQTYRALFRALARGKSPNSFTTSLSYSQSSPNSITEVLADETIVLEEKMEILGFSIGLGKRRAR